MINAPRFHADASSELRSELIEVGPRHCRRGSRGRSRRLGELALVLALGVAGCGGGDADREEGTASATGVGADAGGDQKAACSPVGEELESRSTRTVPIELRDFAFSPSEVEVSPGVVTFAARNLGSENHEVAFLPGGGEVPLTAEGEPDEDALGDAGAFELEAFGPGQSCNASYDLEPGTYTLFCIVTSADGQTHYEKGMRGKLVVA